LAAWRRRYRLLPEHTSGLSRGDRTLWNPKAIHDSIGYIEANPVRLKLISSSEEWLWSSARARKTGKGVVPDVYTMPVKLDNPQKQRVGIV